VKLLFITVINRNNCFLCLWLCENCGMPSSWCTYLYNSDRMWEDETFCSEWYHAFPAFIVLLVLSFIHSLVFSLEGQAWQEPEPSHVTSMALAHCILGKFLGVGCHCFPPPLLSLRPCNFNLFQWPPTYLCAVIYVTFTHTHFQIMGDEGRYQCFVGKCSHHIWGRYLHLVCSLDTTLVATWAGM